MPSFLRRDDFGASCESPHAFRIEWGDLDTLPGVKTDRFHVGGS